MKHWRTFYIDNMTRFSRIWKHPSKIKYVQLFAVFNRYVPLSLSLSPSFMHIHTHTHRLHLLSSKHVWNPLKSNRISNCKCNHRTGSIYILNTKRTVIFKSLAKLITFNLLCCVVSESLMRRQRYVVDTKTFNATKFSDIDEPRAFRIFFISPTCI